MSSTKKQFDEGYTRNFPHEIEWLKKEIEKLEVKKAKRPRVQKQIDAYKRQIRQKELAMTFDENEEYIKPSEFDKKGTEMKYHNTMDKKHRDVGAKTKVRPETVVIRDTKTGKVYGRRTLFQKSTEGKEMSLLPNLLNIIVEATDMTKLPEQVIGELKKLIRKGAQDLEQDWESTLELVHKAYQVANVRRPAPSQKGAWKQYEDMISYAARELFKTRGINGNWRMTSSAIHEAAQLVADMPVGKRRFFVEMDDEGSVEVVGKSMDDIIEQLTNKMRRHSAKLRIDERMKKYAVLSVWIDGAKRTTITVKEIS